MINHFLPNFLHFVCNIIFIHSLNLYIFILIRKHDLNSNLINILGINYLRSNFEVMKFMINYYFHYLNNIFPMNIPFFPLKIYLYLINAYHT